MNETTRKGFRLALVIALGVGMIGVTAAAVVVVDDGGAVRVHDSAGHGRVGYRTHGTAPGWLGIVMYGTSGDGTIVKKLVEDGPADRAGVKEGDRIRSIDGAAIEDYWDITNVLRKKEPGDKVSLEIDRDGERRTLDVTLGERPRRSSVAWYSSDDSDDDDADVTFVNPRGGVIRIGGNRLYLGVEVHEMSDALRGFFKAPEDTGVLVNRVIEDTPADRAGLRAGDVIIEVDGDDIRSVGDISSALRSHDAGDEVPVTVIRDRSRRTIDVTLEKREGYSVLTPGMLVMPEAAPRLGSLKMLDKGMEQLRLNDAKREELREQMREVRRQMQELREQMRSLQNEMREKDSRLKDTIRRYESFPGRARRPASYDI